MYTIHILSMFATVISSTSGFLNYNFELHFNFLDAIDFLLIEQCPISILNAFFCLSSIVVLFDCIISLVILMFNFVPINMFIPLLCA